MNACHPFLLTLAISHLNLALQTVLSTYRHALLLPSWKGWSLILFPFFLSPSLPPSLLPSVSFYRRNLTRVLAGSELTLSCWL